MSDAKRQKLAMVPPPPPTPGSGVAALASLAATAASLSDRFATRLHVKNIAFSLSLAELRHFFAPWGVKEVDLLYDVSAGRHRGFAFVDLNSPEAAAEVLARCNGAILGGRSLQISRPKHLGIGASPVSLLGPPAGPPSAVCFLFNAPGNLQPEDVSRLAGSFGTVLACEPVEAAVSAFIIQFFSVGEAEAAQQGLQGFVLAGATLQARLALPIPPEAAAFAQQASAFLAEQARGVASVIAEGAEAMSRRLAAQVAQSADRQRLARQYAAAAAFASSISVKGAPRG